MGESVTSGACQIVDRTKQAEVNDAFDSSETDETSTEKKFFRLDEDDRRKRASTSGPVKDNPSKIPEKSSQKFCAIPSTNCLFTKQNHESEKDNLRNEISEIFGTWRL
eukprot:GHVP01065158.1.p4 GENE.GHVP01065158.1~~GHVP01065158.1.p4  ORF type:complete len:108 (-),score=20.31 GHVP01065158.1:193-516(-)